MKNVLLTTHRKQVNVFGYLPIVFLFLFMSACFASSLPAGSVGQPSPVDNMIFPDSQGIRNGVMTSGDACPTREYLISKSRTLQIPFIANNGQVDERVRFYARTFGGTVFVTKDGEIVYSLPSGRDVPAGASQESECAVYGYSPLFRVDNVNCPAGRVLAKALLAAYLPGLQKETTQRVVSTPPTNNPGVLPANNNPHSKIQNPQSPTRAIALKEHLVGGKIDEIRGRAQSVTKVSYFKGNDPSKWKSNVSTYEVVDMGEVYKGIGLSLKAHGNNVEKLFCVKPGANPEQIKIRLDGVNECGMRSAECGVQSAECGIACPKSKIQIPKSKITDKPLRRA